MIETSQYNYSAVDILYTCSQKVYSDMNFSFTKDFPLSFVEVSQWWVFGQVSAAQMFNYILKWKNLV